MTTYPSHPFAPRRRQRGAAAVELAILLPLLLAFLTIPVFYARCFWHYSVAQKAAQDATRYLATVSTTEMMSKAQARAAGALAIEIARREMAELAPGSEITEPTAYCDNVDCGVKPTGSLPTTVRIYIQFNMFDHLFGAVDVGWDGWPITADVTMNYAGN
jgi:Flp pilus assembly protein TadG